jgi:uncharacterized protein YggE
MKKLLYILSTSLVLILALISAGCDTSAGGNSPNINLPSIDLQAMSAPGIITSQQSVGLWVNGEGKISTVPDIAILTLGVQVQLKTVAEAQRQAADSMNRVMKVIKGKNVADKDIQTQGYSIYPVWQWNDKTNQQILIGYNVTNNIIVKIRKLDDTGGIIDAVAEAAGNDIRINNINFSIDDPTPFQKQAREKAISDAMEKAKQMASLSGVKLGKPIYITESTSSPSPVIMRSLVKADSASAPTPISAGELDIIVNVQIVFNIN